MVIKAFQEFSASHNLVLIFMLEIVTGTKANSWLDKNTGPKRSRMYFSLVQ